MPAMLGHIWWRFEWHFAVGAVATLLLDVTKTVGFFALAGPEFNLAAVAALLTIIGYSLHDKVVLYDRLRENMRLTKAMPLRAIIDLSFRVVGFVALVVAFVGFVDPAAHRRGVGRRLWSTPPAIAEALTVEIYVAKIAARAFCATLG